MLSWTGYELIIHEIIKWITFAAKESVDSLCVCGQDDGEQDEENEQSWWLHDPRKWAMLVFLWFFTFCPKRPALSASSRFCEFAARKHTGTRERRPASSILPTSHRTHSLAASSSLPCSALCCCRRRLATTIISQPTAKISFSLVTWRQVVA